ERHAGADVHFARTVEVDLHGDGGLLGGPLDAADPVHPRISLLAARKASFSSGVPMLTRRWLGMPTSRISTPSARYPRHAAGASSNRPNRMKLASLGTTWKPSPVSAAATRSRSAASFATEPSVASAWDSAARAAAWVSAARW